MAGLPRKYIVFIFVVSFGWAGAPFRVNGGHIMAFDLPGVSAPLCHDLCGCGLLVLKSN
jgi:hypothetical protein